MKFDRDIFISYAHIDNESLADGQEGWVSTFHRGLEIRLAQLRGEKPRIWRDQKLQGNDGFSDTILELFPSLALFVPIVSPRYVKSMWCLRELEHFANAAEAKGGLRIGDKARIFKVIKTYLPRDKHPQALDSLLGYEFFDFDEAGRPREFSRLYGPEAERKFWAKIEDLAYDIHKTLDLLESLPESDGPATVPVDLATSLDRKVIYLAETTPDLNLEREKVRRELEQRGHRVLPDLPLPNPPDFELTVRQYLAQSTLSVHLISPYETRRASQEQPHTQEAVYRDLALVRVREQVTLAVQASQEKSDFSHILWMPSGAVESEADAFLQSLKTDINFFSTDIESLKRIIRSRLSRSPDPLFSPPKTDIITVYLDCDERDLETPEIEPLYDWLNQKFQVVLPDFEGASLTREEALMRGCEAVIIYYGEASGLWLKRRLLALKKMLYGRSKELRAKAVYVAHPHRQIFSDPDVPIIEAFEGFRSDLLNPFLEQLGEFQWNDDEVSEDISANLSLTDLEAEREETESISFSVTLDLDTEVIALGNLFEASIGILIAEDQAVNRNIIHEFTCKFSRISNEARLDILIVSTTGFQIENESSASIFLNFANGYDNYYRSAKTNFSFLPIRTGHGEIELELFLDNAFLSRVKKEINIADLKVPYHAQLPLGKSRPVPYPDLIVQASVISLENDSSLSLQYRIDGFHPRTTELEGITFCSAPFSLTEKREIEQILAINLSQCSSAQSRNLEPLASIGSFLYKKFLPLELRDLLESLFSVGDGLNILVLSSSYGDLPWEIMHNGRSFLSEKFLFSHWYLEYQRNIPHNFPIGDIHLAYYSNTSQTENWLDLFDIAANVQPYFSSSGLIQEISEILNFRGLHIVRNSIPSEEDDLSYAPLPVDARDEYIQDIDEATRPSKLAIRLNRPTISLSHISNGHLEITDLDRTWASTFVGKVCSAFVGSLWSVKPDVEAAFISNFYHYIARGQSLGKSFSLARQMVRIACPDSIDWLAYVLYGDPMARPYRPSQGRGYAIVECIAQDLDKPMPLDRSVRFRATLSRTPPIWYEDRLMDVVESLNFEKPKIYINASGIDISPDEVIDMVRTPAGDYISWFSLVFPKTLAGQMILVQVHFEDGDEPLDSQRLKLKVAEN